MLVAMVVPAGAEAPDFELKDQNNQPVRLGSFRGRQNVLIVFYPLAFTGTCGGELCQVRDKLSDFQNDKLQILSISVDSVYVHKVWSSQEGFDFPLLADFWPHGAVAKSYGVFNEERGYANRGTFLVDVAGTVRFAELHPPAQPRDQSTWRAAIESL
jgi:peroxiredoxin